MAAAKGLDKFQEAMINAAQKHLRPSFESSDGSLAEVIKNHLFDLDGPRSLAASGDPRDAYFGTAFRGFNEITKSLEALDDIAFYIRRFPFAGTKIDPARYLQFHVEAHFSEIYILRERLVRYLKTIERTFRRDPLLSEFKRVAVTLVAEVDSTLQGVMAVRGRHVHEVRFSDEGIDRLNTISLLTRGSDDELSTLMKTYHRIEHRKVRKKWRDTTSGNIKALRMLLDRYFEALYPVVFSEDDSSLRYSGGVRPTRRRSGSN